MNRHILLALVILAAIAVAAVVGALLVEHPPKSLCFSYLPCESTP